jgi:S-(hydroxymethyl)glutathione dehydrogenase/alcohol dehydrogenase
MLFSAAVLEQINTPLSSCEGISVPALSRGQVLVHVAYSGVCHSQLMEARGARGEDKYLPHLLGHEGTGRVEAVGDGVTKVKLGDWVVLGWIKGTGIDATGAKYAHAGRQINAGGVTTFNEMAVVSENRLVLLPHGVPLDIGVLFGCALPTGAGIVTNTIRPVAGSTLAVFGLGGIGMSALMATQLFECRQVIAIDINPEKLALAKEFGATHVIDAMQSGVLDQIRQLTGGAGADYSVEATGRAQTIELAFDAVRRGGGLCVFASHPAHGSRISLDPFELICGKRILGSWGGECRPDEDIPKFADLYRQGRLPLEKLITKRYRLDQINEALDDLEAQRVGRPLIEISPLLASQYDASQS